MYIYIDSYSHIEQHSLGSRFCRGICDHLKWQLDLDCWMLMDTAVFLISIVIMCQDMSKENIITYQHRRSQIWIPWSHFRPILWLLSLLQLLLLSLVVVLLLVLLLSEMGTALQGWPKCPNHLRKCFIYLFDFWFTFLSFFLILNGMDRAPQG